MTVSRQLKTVAALGLLSSAVWASTFASFTDSATASDATFSAGTIDILLSGDPDDAVSFASLNALNLKPGDTHYASLPVRNDGTLDFTYTMTTVADGALAPELDLGVRVLATGATCDDTTYAAAGASSVVPSNTTLSSSLTFEDRALASATAELLCFRLELPVAETTGQGEDATANFTFTATQLTSTDS